MQIPILKGTYATTDGNYRTAYPRNNIPVPKENGVSNGQFRPSPGLVEFATGPGLVRGGINWKGSLYRVMGSKLVHIDRAGVVTEIGDVGPDGPVTMVYSFDHLAIASDKKLFLYNGKRLEQVTDEDLGDVLNVIWIDGYFLTTDGDALVVGELNDPFDINVLRYGSSEINPDPVVGVIKHSNEAYAVNRYSIEVFNNVGGTGFPFRRIEGAAIERGAVGTQAFTVFENSIAFLGSALNEEVAVWRGVSGQDIKISTQEIDEIIAEYSEEELASTVVETRLTRNHRNLYIHLPDQTLVHDAAATQKLGMPIWYTLDSGLIEKEQYRARHFVFCYDKWTCGDTKAARVGVLTDDVSDHYGDAIRWDVQTSIVFNDARGFIIHEMELTSLTGRVAVGKSPVVFASHSEDGVLYSQGRPKKVGGSGARGKRIRWAKMGYSEATRLMRFHGTSDGHIGIARLDVVIEGCAY